MTATASRRRSMSASAVLMSASWPHPVRANSPESGDPMSRGTALAVLTPSGGRVRRRRSRRWVAESPAGDVGGCDSQPVRLGAGRPGIDRLLAVRLRIGVDGVGDVEGDAAD